MTHLVHEGHEDGLIPSDVVEEGVMELLRR
jgi:hypothetical protein